MRPALPSATERLVPSGHELYPPTGVEHPAYLLARPVS
jgi:hypothetical protein